MAHKIVDATALRVGGFVTIEGDCYVIKSMDVSKTGKHGHAKCRFEAVSLTGLKKKVLVVPGHERFEVPLIDKRKAQVLSVMGEKVSLMDSDNFETLELDVPADLASEIKEGIIVEYWDIEGVKIVKRTL